VTPRRWRHLARSVLAGASPAFDSLRTLARADMEILPFQLEPAIAVIRGLAVRLLIADEVGLGKTVQAGLILSETLERDADAHALVVTPAALRHQWAAELHSRFGLAPVVLESRALPRYGERVIAGANPWAAHPLVVTSIDYVKRPEVLRSLEALIWDVVVIDEAHALAGRSDRNAAAAMIGQRTRTLVMLTATPHSGDDQAFARLCGIGDLERRFPLAVFRRTRQDAGLASTRRATWLRVAPTAAELDMHGALIEYARLVWRRGSTSSGGARLAMLVLARRACSSAWSLARSASRRLSLLTDSERGPVQIGLPLGPSSGDDEPASELGGAGLDDGDDERRRLEDLVALAVRAQRGESKLSAIHRLLRRTREPAIIFTEYRDTLSALASELSPFATAQLHGGLNASERDDVLRQFRSGEVSVLLATDAASEGLNLHHRCRLVVDLELPWTPLKLEQRVGRVDRIGQRRRVHQVHLVAARTSEDAIIAPLLRDRTGRVRQALAAMGPPAVQEHEIAERVLGHGAPRPPDDSNPPTLPAGLQQLDLSAAARVEANRAAAARTLIAGSARIGSGVSSRPFASALVRQGARACWAFRLEFSDEEEAVAWEAILGISYRLDRVDFDRASAVRRHAGMAIETLKTYAGERQRLLLADVLQTLEPAIDAAIVREQAIVTAVERRHARLASSIVQAGLFDRRLQRDAAAQQDALRDTVARCQQRLMRLTRQRRVVCGAIEPAFAVILR
jgi:superfamily II DNA or RNA helicase